MARSKLLTGPQLKAFRHHVSILKKKGLISKTDARSAQPYWIRNGKRLDKVVASYDDVLSGKAEAVKVTPAQLKQYKKAGYDTEQDRVIIPQSAGERATVTKSGTIKVQKIKKPETGIKRVELPIPFRDLRQWVEDGRKQAEQLDSLKGGRKLWAYKLYGHRSYATYSDLTQLFRELSIGTASGLNLMDKAREETRKQQNELYQNLTLFAVPSDREWPRGNMGRGSRTSKAARQRYTARIKATPIGERARARHAAEERERRAKLKQTGGKALAEYKRKAKARAKKSRKNQG